ncbi:MAG: hypothetical protein ACKVY0_22845 [Prosthecobacter sp.]|uniref:hypothetical protein n=1 Tax=Prosthecobacter sp. TaxID=1965333 RepID=UPI0038FF124D
MPAHGDFFTRGLGNEQTPEDLVRIPFMLKNRIYKDEDIANIMHGNYLRFVREAWAE